MTATPKRKPAKDRLRLPFAQVMAELEAAGAEQTRKTYRRHRVAEPMFGVSFATLKLLYKRIGVDHELARALWATENFDARNLAMKIADPAQMGPEELTQWARETATALGCGTYVAVLASEGVHGRALAEAWLAAPDEARRAIGWALVGQLAHRDPDLADAWFAAWIHDIAARIHTVGNGDRYAMNQALIAVGCRNAPLRDAALAAAARIGKVEVDHGDTDCKTPDIAASIDKAWTHSTGKGFASPGAHERTRESPRLRC